VFTLLEAMSSFLMFSPQMPSTPWTAASETAASEGRGRRADGLGGGWPGAYRRGAPHSQRDRASSSVSFARKARLDVRPIRAFCGRSRACSCGHARRSGWPSSRRRPRVRIVLTDLARPGEIEPARAPASSSPAPRLLSAHCCTHAVNPSSNKRRIAALGAERLLPLSRYHESHHPQRLRRWRVC
jgi:hypothetical protein